jgi:hypothetical protein
MMHHDSISRWCEIRHRNVPIVSGSEIGGMDGGRDWFIKMIAISHWVDANAGK